MHDRGFHLYDILEEAKFTMTGKAVVVVWGFEVVWRYNYKGENKIVFGGDGTILCTDCGSGYRNLYIYQNP